MKSGPSAKNEDPRMLRKKSMKQYWDFVKPYRYYILLIILLGMMQFIVPLSVPYMTKIMIDEILNDAYETNWTVQKFVTALGIIFTFGVIISFVRNFAAAHLGNTMALDLRRKLYAHIQGLSQRFYDSRQTGSIVSRVLHDVNGAQNLVGGGVINLAVDLFLIIFAGIMLFTLDWELALLSLWILPMYYLTFTNLNVRIRFAWRTVHRQLERISGVLVERISGISVVKAFNSEKKELKRYDKQAKHHYKYAMNAHILSNLLGSLSQIFNHIGVLIIWFVGGMAVLNGNMTVGALIAFNGYLAQLYGPIQRFSQVNVTIQNSMANIERIFEIFDIEPDIKNPEKPKPITSCKGEIVFENVHFTYITERQLKDYNLKEGDPDLVDKYKPEKPFYFIPPRTKPLPPPTIEERKKALKGINFTARSGEVIALVGPSGAGKTTLVQFIPRFYDPEKGRVLLDGTDLKQYDLYDLRRQIAIVMQDNILFSGSVYENIAYGRPEATEAEVIAAARAANAHDFIMEWKEGYETILGERGVRLSGGQKQRIAIARALLKNPKILILDEATSALDAESEFLVTQALERLMQGRTTFIIAHRLATVVRADKILVMNGGKIVESGTHTQLLAKGGLYRDLYDKQLKAMRPDELLVAQA